MNNNYYVQFLSSKSNNSTFSIQHINRIMLCNFDQNNVVLVSLVIITFILLYFTYLFNCFYHFDILCWYAICELLDPISVVSIGRIQATESSWSSRRKHWPECDLFFEGSTRVGNFFS